MTRTAAEDAVWMYRRLRARRGVDIDYQRGDTRLPLRVYVGRTPFASNVQGKARLEWGERDYFILASELAALGEPAEGDRIEEVIGGATLTFEAMAPLGEPAVRFSDPTRQIYRVHCQRVPG